MGTFSSDRRNHKLLFRFKDLKNWTSREKRNLIKHINLRKITYFTSCAVSARILYLKARVSWEQIHP